MKKNYLAPTMLALSLFTIFSVWFQPIPVLAQSLWEKQEGRNEISRAFGEDWERPRDIRDVTVTVIRVFLTFLSLIVVIMIMLGGFRWMTAAGNEDRVKDAKHMIKSAVIGLIIILSAFAILEFTYNLFYEFFDRF